MKTRRGFFGGFFGSIAGAIAGLFAAPNWINGAMVRRDKSRTIPVISYKLIIKDCKSQSDPKHGFTMTTGYMRIEDCEFPETT